VQTTVSVKDGETVVIGGLIKENETKNVDKVWLLGDIPLLGYLFRHTSTKKEKTDLLIFITTKIMPNS
ncbi:MAG: type II secretion system protein GspD, partial [Calditrichaeota bacterium]